MENKCNKTPNNNNCNYMDHVYCHTNESKNYMRSNNNTIGPTSAGMLKENKQLKSMLILHLDLIQEQNEQLMAKEKQLAQQAEEMEAMHALNAQQGAQIQELQRQLQRHLKRAAAAAGELSTLPPPLAKIQCTQAEPNAAPKTNIIGECNGKFISKIILQRVNLSDREGTQSTNSSTVSESASEAAESVSREPHDEDDIDEFFDSEHYEIDDTEHVELDEENEHLEEDEEDVEVEVEVAMALADVDTTEDSIDDVLANLSRGAKPSQSSPNLNSLPLVPAVCATPPTPPSRGKQMPLMRWHAPDIHSDDESASGDSQVDADTAEQCPNLAAPDLHKTHNDASSLTTPHNNYNIKPRRCAYISTKQLYSTREWAEDEFRYDYEFIKEEENALHADAPMLEIPKWTEHDELTPSYCMEGTEDLSDEAFLKRHFKLEVDEKRRKKWDVQQIREQRRIEKLKRRHCKTEIQTAVDQQPLVSFYPQTETLEAICFVHELPVQAFGEMLPKLNSGEFALPWLTKPEMLDSSTISTNSAINTYQTVTTLSSASLSVTSAQALQQMMNSSFIFLKKRRRIQSISTAATPQQSALTRQRSTVATRSVTQSVPPNTLTIATEATK